MILKIKSIPSFEREDHVKSKYILITAFGCNKGTLWPFKNHYRVTTTEDDREFYLHFSLKSNSALK